MQVPLLLNLKNVCKKQIRKLKSNLIVSVVCHCFLACLIQPVTQRLGAVGRKAQSINTIKREQATNEVRRKKNKKNEMEAKKG